MPAVRSMPAVMYIHSATAPALKIDHIRTMGVTTHFLEYIPKDVWNFLMGGREQTLPG